MKLLEIFHSYIYVQLTDACFI